MIMRKGQATGVPLSIEYLAMEIKVRLHGSLQRHSDRKRDLMRFDVPDSTTVGDVLGRLDLPRSEIWITVVDGKLAYAERRLEDGDELEIFPPVAGG